MKKVFLFYLVFNIVMLPIFFIFMPKIAFVPIVALTLQLVLCIACAIVDSSDDLILSRAASIAFSLTVYFVAVVKILFEGQAIS